MLVSARTPEGIEVTCEGCCPSHSSSVRKLHRATKRALKKGLKRREERAWRADARREGLAA